MVENCFFFFIVFPYECNVIDTMEKSNRLLFISDHVLLKNIIENGIE